MGLQSWREVREVLLGFNYNDALQPNGSIRFWKTTSVKVAPADGIEQAEKLLLK
jgi:hypothetical protein